MGLVHKDKGIHCFSLLVQQISEAFFIILEEGCVVFCSRIWVFKLG